MAGIHIIPVRKKSEMKQFIDLPWDIYKRDDNWVPPLKMVVKKLLNPDKHPFWKFSERELFLAKRGDEIISPSAKMKIPRKSSEGSVTKARPRTAMPTAVTMRPKMMEGRALKRSLMRDTNTCRMRMMYPV